MTTEAWAIITALASTVSALALYINRQAINRVQQLETENGLLRIQLDKVSDRTLLTSQTLERVVNASVDREAVLLTQLAGQIRHTNGTQ